MENHHDGLYVKCPSQAPVFEYLIPVGSAVLGCCGVFGTQDLIGRSLPVGVGPLEVTPPSIPLRSWRPGHLRISGHICLSPWSYPVMPFHSNRGRADSEVDRQFSLSSFSRHSDEKSNQYHCRLFPGSSQVSLNFICPSFLNAAT